jgi:hypothetical protein
MVHQSERVAISVREVATRISVIVSADFQCRAEFVPKKAQPGKNAFFIPIPILSRQERSDFLLSFFSLPVETKKRKTKQR